MENKEYLSEEKYQQTNAKVKKVGKILLIVGIIILVIGFFMLIFGFFGMASTITGGIESFGTGNLNVSHTTKSIFGNYGLFALSGVMNSIGLGLIGVGAILMFVAHRREIKAYSIQQTMPLEQERIEKMAPTTGKAAGGIAEEIAKGIKQGINEADENK